MWEVGIMAVAVALGHWRVPSAFSLGEMVTILGSWMIFPEGCNMEDDNDSEPIGRILGNVDTVLRKCVVRSVTTLRSLARGFCYRR